VDAESIATGSTSTGTPVNQDMPASASTSFGSVDVSWLTLAPPARFANCQRPVPLCPQPCGTAIVPGTMSAVSETGSAI
jgi:hypothetical protein